MSRFSDFLEDHGVDLEPPIEPEEIRWLCEDPVFLAVARYCLSTKGTPNRRNISHACFHPDEAEGDSSMFDRDELGIPPEEDYDAAIDVQ